MPRSTLSRREASPQRAAETVWYDYSDGINSPDWNASPFRSLTPTRARKKRRAFLEWRRLQRKKIEDSIQCARGTGSTAQIADVGAEASGFEEASSAEVFSALLSKERQIASQCSKEASKLRSQLALLQEENARLLTQVTQLRAETNELTRHLQRVDSAEFELLGLNAQLRARCAQLEHDLQERCAQLEREAGGAMSVARARALVCCADDTADESD